MRIATGSSKLLVLLVFLALAASAGASPSSALVLREGANHHIGDDSFVAAFGRPPTRHDSEALRMRVHFEYVHDLLAKKRATSPELEAKRKELLGYLADYTNKGTTPKNTYVPYRTPVFIDKDGTICAVGYLIEKTAGREVAEKVAATHRLDYFENIAAAMPEVDAWVKSSGFTLDELATIQPGYTGPDVMYETGWLTAKTDEDDIQGPIGVKLPPDGAFHDVHQGVTLDGTFAKEEMQGNWSRKREGVVLGSGTFKNGAGTWTSFRADGTRLAVGPFKHSHASGRWTFFHPSGRIAAVGRMSGGQRDGTWTFYYDNETHAVLSKGSFFVGEVMSGWKHFDEGGNLVARATGKAWDTMTLHVEPGSDGVRREIHEGIPADNYRLDGLYKGNDKLYVNQAGTMYDGRAMLVEMSADGWIEHSCSFKKSARAAAASGDVERLHGKIMFGDNGDCDDAGKPMSAKRAARYDALLASRDVKHGDIPAFDIDPQPIPATKVATAETPVDAGGEVSDATATPEPASDSARDGVLPPPSDLVNYLADTMTWYIEWPHVDDTFRTVYATLPGYDVHSAEENIGE